MSEKSEFRFVFPKLGTEHKALANAAHIEPVTSIVMGEHNADLCVVYWGETLMFVCIYDKNCDKKFRFLYEDKSERTEIKVVYGPEAFIEAIDCENIEEALNEADSEIERTFIHTRNRSFYSQEEAQAYVWGFEDGMDVTDHDDDFRFVSEENYSKIQNWYNNG